MTSRVGGGPVAIPPPTVRCVRVCERTAIVAVAVALLAGCAPGSGGTRTPSAPSSAPSTGPTSAPRTAGTTTPAASDDAPSTLPGGWLLAWHDEFDGPAGAPPDPARWDHDTGAGGWGNGELQRYTDSTANARLSGDGTLEIVALRTPAGWTSARLTTRSTHLVRYGRFEARLRLPAGRGLWPAFWLNGLCKAGWPACGEIDVMESMTPVPRTVRARVHLPGPDARGGLGGEWQVRAALDEGFHVYGAVWDESSVAFTFDGHEYARVRRDALPAGTTWELDHDAYLILNLAVGGAPVDPPDATTPSPAVLAVDWVRQYTR